MWWISHFFPFLMGLYYRDSFCGLGFSLVFDFITDYAIFMIPFEILPYLSNKEVQYLPSLPLSWINH